MRNLVPPLLIPTAGFCTALALACGGSDLTLPSEGRPALVAVVDGNDQTAPEGQPVADPLVIRVTDGEARPVAQIRVAFVVTVGGGSISPDTATTDSDGRTSARWTLGPATGAQQAEARVVGSDAIKATFRGTASAVNSGPKRTTTQITAANPSPSFPTQPVVVAFQVTSSDGTPSGTVTVTDGSVSCSASAPGGQCSVAPATAGSKTFTARYAGSSNFAPSSGTADHSVVRAGTSASLSSSANPSERDQEVTFTATVTSSFKTPGGQVQFVEGSCDDPTKTWATEGLDDSGRAEFSTRSLSSGTHLMVACYPGTDTYAPSESNVVEQKVSRKGHD
jgi:Bacterial Ig-like domain (group 3)